MYDVSGTIVLVTGASSGIGRACAERFLAAGARVIAAARRQERLEDLAEGRTENLYRMQLDVRDRKGVERGIASLPAAWSRIDILVNNAGLGRGLEKIHLGDVDGWEEMIDTNIKGLLFVSRAVIPGMVARNAGHIINIGSIAGHQVYPNGNVYCATKHAVDALTQGMRLDLVDTAIRVSTVDPGLVETEFSIVRFGGDSQRAAGVYKGYTPLSADDVADAVVWAASRPPHVQIAEIIIFPTAQASAMVTHRTET